MLNVKAISPLPSDAATRTEFNGVLVPLATLADQMLASGRRIGLEGVKFTNCLIQGPAVIVPGAETTFEGCNLGNVHGDVRNLFLLAVGPMITGAIPVYGCHFQDCEFRGVGFAGEHKFIEKFVTELTRRNGPSA